MLYTVAEVEPPDPAGKSSTLGTSQLWEWSHWIRGEMRGVPTGTGYLTAGYSCLLSILILQNKQEKNIYETIIAFIMFCNITKSVLTHSCRSCLCEKERTPSCWHVLSSTRAKWNKWAWGCASEWPGEEVRVIQFECCSKKKKICLLLDLRTHYNLYHSPAVKRVELSPPPQHCQEWGSGPPGRVQGSPGCLHGIQLRNREPECSPILSGGWMCWSNGESEGVGFLSPEKVHTEK